MDNKAMATHKHQIII